MDLDHAEAGDHFRRFPGRVVTMNFRFALASLALLATAGVAKAETPQDDALGQCLVLKSTGADRVALVRWMFATMSDHPSIGPLVSITDAEREAIDRQMASLVERLLLVDCLHETESLSGPNSQAGLEKAFGQFGRIATTEIFGNAQVNAASGAFARYMDQKKLAAALNK